MVRKKGRLPKSTRMSQKELVSHRFTTPHPSSRGKVTSHITFPSLLSSSACYEEDENSLGRQRVQEVKPAPSAAQRPSEDPGEVSRLFHSLFHGRAEL